jgi:hypothetical protein
MTAWAWMTRREITNCVVVLLNILAGRRRQSKYDGVEVDDIVHTALLLSHRGLVRWYPMRLTARGRDALATWLLRDFGRSDK